MADTKNPDDLNQENIDDDKTSTEYSKERTGLSHKRTGMSEERTGLSHERTELSFQRTALSYERTLMSWIRTSVSLISFGFTFYKFFQEITTPENRERWFLSPRIIGMILIAFGFVGLLFAEIQHHAAIKKLKEEYPEIQHSLSQIFAILILVFGLVLFIVALSRH